jgi:demethoxyubiquinone hydroxylase (CLK1/Coq7/Cat5 family)
MIGPSQMLTTSGALSRSRLIRLGLGGGAGLVAAGAELGAARPARAQAAGEPTEGDLATVRLLASGELLAQAFYTSALASKKLSKGEAADLARALDNERDHYTALKQILGDAAPLADDFEFAFPRDAFARRGRMLRLGATIETALAGTYASAAATASTLELRALLAQIAVSEAQHVAVLNRIRGGAPAPSFPELLDVEQASAALGPFFGD